MYKQRKKLVILKNKRKKLASEIKFREKDFSPFVEGKAGSEADSPIVSLFPSTVRKARAKVLSSALSSNIRVEAISVISP